MNAWAGWMLGVSLMILGLGLLWSGCMSGRAAAPRRDPTKVMSGPRQPLNHRSIVERSGTAAHIDAIRIKLGFPAEVFEEAVRPVIEAYGEFVEGLPTAEPHHRDFVERITYSIELADLALDLRRDQILPPGAAPEAIGEHAQRWTYAVFLAALLHDVGQDSREPRTMMRNREASPASRPSVRGFWRNGSTSNHGTRVEVSLVQPELNVTRSVLLLSHFVSAAILEWLAADAGLMRELHAFLSGDEPAQVGAIGALVQQAEMEAARRHAGTGSRDALLSTRGAEDMQPPERLMNSEAGSTSATDECGAEQAQAHVGVSAEQGTAGPAPVAFIRPVMSEAEYLEDGDAKRRAIASHRATGMPAPLERAPDAPSQVMLRGVADSAGSRSDPAHRFMSWLKQGLAEGTLLVNGPRAWVHFVPEGMLLVSPRIFQAYATRFGEDGEGNAGLVADANVGKLIQRKVLRAGWHVRAEKQVNFHTYQVIHDGRAVSRLSGVLIANPERFVSPVPSANPVLVRLPREIALA